jgi:hypothetical protein
MPEMIFKGFENIYDQGKQKQKVILSSQWGR